MSTAVNAPPGHTFTGTTVLQSVSCPTCGLTFAVPRRMHDKAVELGHGKVTWRCPAMTCSAIRIGFHGLSEAEKQRRRAERAENRARNMAEERDEAERRRIAQKAATTRARKRHAAGVCPCCKRTFRQVRAHMARMHPDYDPATDDA